MFHIDKQSLNKKWVELLLTQLYFLGGPVYCPSVSQTYAVDGQILIQYIVLDSSRSTDGLTVI